ncbi:acyl transferase domain-containing protein [Catenulispora sp. EB89]|uniref:type I polyketide synthase n=1 Tax=Catenulispora sp. EB89 TaxID=3156257 RepID=UPI0035137BF4
MDVSAARTDVAVVGMACRFPGVSGLEEFWRLLVDGRSTVGSFPGQRGGFPQNTADPDAATLSSGSFFEAVDGFDAGFFGTGPAEAAAMDPVQRLGLELAWEAVEDARMPASALAGRQVDVVVGAAPSGYEQLRAASGSDRDDHYAALGSSGALVANRISNLFDVRGMSFCADSGQSSSLVALALACDRIRGGAVETVLAGGVQLIVDPASGAGLANLGVLSPDGRSHTFDARANGFVRGEGGAFVVLKRLDLAVADGDHVYAVVRGWGVGGTGAAARMPDPSPSAQAATVLTALRSADVPFDGVDYVEAHGTGTRRGDPAEIAGLREVSRRSGRDHVLAIGSVKTNVGHLEAAAGITGFVKTALCLDRARLVPSLNFESPNPDIPRLLEDFEVVVRARPWPGGPDRPRRAGVSSFGMGGTNAHAILEQAPEPRRTPESDSDSATGPGPGTGPDTSAEPVHEAGGAPGMLPWVLSARSASALREQAERLRDFMAVESALSVADIGYSLTATRSSFEHRAVVLGTDRAELLAGLDTVAADRNAARLVRGVATAPTGPVVFVFPGQGSQWPGMGRRLYAESEVFASSIDECARALAPWVDWSLVDVVTGVESTASLEGRDDVIQPALWAMMVSLARVWQSLGVVPQAVVGHSQGEIAAACVSGALSVEDAARVVAVRSKALIELAGSGGLHAVGASRAWAEERLERWPGRLSLAAVNGPSSVLVSGEVEALEEFAAGAEDEGVRVRRVRVDYAAHSHQVERIQKRLSADTEGLDPRPPTVEFHSTVTGGPLGPRLLDGSYWYDNLRSTVRFGEVAENLMRAGAVLVEVSPHPVLAVAMAETADASQTSPVLADTLHKDDGSAGRILASLAELHVRGVPVDWDAVFAAHRPRRVALPTYAFQRQRFWLTAPEATGDAGASGFAAADLISESSVLELVCAEAAAVLNEQDSALTGGDLASGSTRTFKDLGFDSSMAVRLRNRLIAAGGVRLPATVAFTYPTPHALSRHLFSVLAPAEPAAPDPVDTPSEDRSDDDIFELIDRGYV